MSFCCPIHGYYSPPPGVTLAICPTCSSQHVADVPSVVAKRDELRDEIEKLQATVDRLLPYAGPEREAAVRERTEAIVACLRELDLADAVAPPAYHLAMSLRGVLADLIAARFSKQEGDTNA